MAEVAVCRLFVLRGGEISAVNVLIPALCGFGCGIISAWGVGGGTLLLLVMTLVLGVWVLGDRITFSQYAAAALVLAGIYLSQTRK